MRGHDDVGRIPPWAVGRQWFLDEDVEDGTGDATATERVEQSGLVDERAARGVDDPGGRREGGEDVRIDEAARLGSQGYGHDQGVSRSGGLREAVQPDDPLGD